MYKLTKTGDGERLIEPEGSGKIFIRRRDPFGFWHVSFEKGPIPDSLSSAYTTIPQALDAVETYLANSSARKRAAVKE